MKIKQLTAMIALLSSTATYAAIETSAGTANVDLRLRYEMVDQDNALDNASALTLRTVANFKTISKGGFYGFVELENSIAFIDDYNNPVDQNAGYSVVVDPATTELDQAYIGYAANGLSVKVGRQVITLDDHRFVGHVGWRNDKQTFDAISATYDASSKLKLTGAYIAKRNRIFADEADFDSSDILLNAALTTDFGKVVGYGYLLDQDEGAKIDTFGANLTGKASGFSYKVEFATQSTETAAGAEYDTIYYAVEGGTKLGAITVKAGYESLGSDDGNGAFATPLATGHKFNGWADQFLGTPAQGLNDFYLTAAGAVSGSKWAVTYHSYSADEATTAVDDLGSEINAVFNTKVADFPLGIKAAIYSAGDINVDTTKVWLWTGYKF